ncbi:hypothetical protein ACWC24_27725 [Streptomyces sp. NPDC001443]
MRQLALSFDNTANEAFDSAFEVEYVHRRNVRIHTEVRIGTATWITDFHSTRRPHGACGSKDPIDRECEYRTLLTEGPATRIGPAAHPPSPRAPQVGDHPSQDLHASDIEDHFRGGRLRCPDRQDVRTGRRNRQATRANWRAFWA